MSVPVEQDTGSAPEGIAVIGLNGRFPGAKTIDEFWDNLRNGVESIASFSDAELQAAGIDPALIADPNYVKRRGVLESVELFDATFFGYTPREAEVMDPQQRLFLECAWEALEQAGYTADQYSGSIGVYAGTGLNTYLLYNISPNRALIDEVGNYQVLIGNDKDFLATRVSYKLGLKGPSLTVQTACSTSLVAVHMACQSLINYQCDLALAGGVSIFTPQTSGYPYQVGSILSPDGHCRAFDADAQGTVGGSGVGVVALKRLSDAIADGDTIHAVILGSAINNDGAVKVGYTAPSVEGQAEAIAEALGMAEVSPEGISYIEAHGTGTTMGDPIEIAALTQVFRDSTDKKGFCAIGSLKTNVGHMDAAAGVGGLIKTILALKHRQIPPSLHYKQPNPKIDFANSPFYVNATLSDWQTNGAPRRAGVSSFGIGGTNAHVVVQEAPELEESDESRPWQLLTLATKTETALDAATDNLAVYLEQHPEISLADAAYTLQQGRKAFHHRRIVVCRDREDAVAKLRGGDPQFVATSDAEPSERPIAFVFSGQGTQYADMGRELYETEPLFREQIDRCCEILRRHLGSDLREVLYPNEALAAVAAERINQTEFAQPALFVVEYALAQLWMSWGVQPQAMLGHSIGEYVAACLAGVFSLDDALALVAARGRLMQQMPAGEMLAISLPEAEVTPLLGPDLALAAVNGPALCVVAGESSVIALLQQQLADLGVECRQLHTSHAFHSHMMDEMLAAFAAQIKRVKLNPPTLPYLSNVTGTWISPAEALDPTYWVTHLRRTVRFADGLRALLDDPQRIILEIGPGRTLRTLAKKQAAPDTAQVFLSSIRHPHDQVSDVAHLLTTLGKLWLAGTPIDWPSFSANELRRRVPLPTYPFERQPYWVAPEAQPSSAKPSRTIRKNSNIAEWFSVPSWKRTAPLAAVDDSAAQGQSWLIFTDEHGLGAQLVERLRQQERQVIAVAIGEQFAQIDPQSYTINPKQSGDYAALLKAITASGAQIDTIAHGWSITTAAAAHSFEASQERGLYSLLYLVQALAAQSSTTPIQINVLSSELYEVASGEAIVPDKATLLGACKVIPQEHPHLTCRSIDLAVPAPGSWQQQWLIDQLLAECSAPASAVTVAYRGTHRWVQTFEAITLEPSGTQPARLRQGGVYLITGGLGEIGLTLADYLARTVQAKLILVGRSALPARESWAEWLATHAEQDSVSQKLRKIQALEAAGAEVVIASGNVADANSLRAIIDQAEARFGAVHGVIHAAGAVQHSQFRALADTNPQVCQQQFEPKVNGVIALAEALEGRALDFCMLCSSLSAVLGGLQFCAYAAANLFMDAFAARQNQRQPVPWISVNWDGWQSQAPGQTATETRLAEQLIAPAEGVEAFQRLLRLDRVSQVVVSTSDLQAQIERWIKRAPGSKAEAKRSEDGAVLHARPKLRTSYLAPRNPMEQSIAEACQNLLGIQGVGIHDNFFELGGDSLQAVQLNSRLRELFKVELPLRELFENPTIAGIAELVEKHQAAPASDQDLAITRVSRAAYRVKPGALTQRPVSSASVEGNS